jgi:hypothetical protein
MSDTHLNTIQMMMLSLPVIIKKHPYEYEILKHREGVL